MVTRNDSFGQLSDIGLSSADRRLRTGSIPTSANPTDIQRLYVWQQYGDFLCNQREPDEGGFDFCTRQTTQCGVDALCEDGQRKNVSRAFWDSTEFQSRPDVIASGLLNPPGSARPYDNLQFVRWSYKIYLQGEPDQAGWDFWTAQLNGHGDYNEIIRAFICSFDYRRRFGSTTIEPPPDPCETCDPILP